MCDSDAGFEDSELPTWIICILFVLVIGAIGYFRWSHTERLETALANCKVDGPYDDRCRNLRDALYAPRYSR